MCAHARVGRGKNVELGIQWKLCYQPKIDCYAFYALYKQTDHKKSIVSTNKIPVVDTHTKDTERQQQRTDYCYFLG